jgi:hypothetical protein
LTIVDQQGKRVAAIIDGVVAAGRHEAFWDAQQVRAGVYVANMKIAGRPGWAGRIVIAK